MLIDVDGVLDSPLGRREGWRARASSRQDDPLGLPPNLARAAVAAGLDLEGPSLSWRVGMGESRERLPNLNALARHEGGFVESIAKADVVWTPRDLYFLTFDPNILGFVTPANRQAMAQWIRTTFSTLRTPQPSFANQAITRAEGGATIVLAIDLADAISPQKAAPRLAAIEALKASKTDPDLLAQKLATAKSAFFQADVKESIQGMIRVEFEGTVDITPPVAKAVILAALEEAGAEIPELSTWTSTARGRSIELSGRLSEESLGLVLGLARPPRLTDPLPSLAEESAEAPTPAPGAKPARGGEGRCREGVARVLPLGRRRSRRPEGEEQAHL